MHLIHVVARNDVLILSAQELPFCRVEFEGNVDGLSGRIIQTDGCKQFTTDLIANPVPFCLQVLCHTGFCQQIFIDPRIFHLRFLHPTRFALPIPSISQQHYFVNNKLLVCHQKIPCPYGRRMIKQKESFPLSGTGRTLVNLTFSLRKGAKGQNHSMILPTTPEPTVRPPSRIAKRRPSSIATGVSSSTCIMTLSPGMHISVPSGRVMIPVTSVVRK